LGLAASDPEGQARVGAFRKVLNRLGWTEGGNLKVDYRWAAGDVARTRALAAELVSSAPEVIVVNTPPGLAALRDATSSIPIVFVQVLGASESGVVANPARPEANLTGFTHFYEYVMGSKWLALLKEMVPTLTRVAVMQNPDHPSWLGYRQSIAAAAPALGVQMIPAAVKAADDIDKALDELARTPESGLLVLPDTFTTVHRVRIVALAAKHRLPAIYPVRFFAAVGGLMTYGADVVELLGLAATYVDRILRGAAPHDLPVQATTKFELVINLKTAKALGLEVPPSLLARADEVIE
jgi:putative ABC transport system substrate-binding protein